MIGAPDVSQLVFWLPTAYNLCLHTLSNYITHGTYLGISAKLTIMQDSASNSKNSKIGPIGCVCRHGTKSTINSFFFFFSFYLSFSLSLPVFHLSLKVILGFWIFALTQLLCILAHLQSPVKLHNHNTSTITQMKTCKSCTHACL